MVAGRKQEPRATTGPCPQCPASTPNPPILTICNIAMRRHPRPTISSLGQGYRDRHQFERGSLRVRRVLRPLILEPTTSNTNNQQPTTTTTNNFNFLQPINTTTSIAVTSFQRTTDEEFVMTPKLLFLVLLLGLGCQEVIMQ